MPEQTSNFAEFNRRGDSSLPELWEDLGETLTQLGAWLKLTAQAELADDVRSKLGASDIVQQTLLEAQRDWGNFQGSTVKELSQWLRQILTHNLHDVAGRYLRAEKRDVRREIPLHDRDDSCNLRFELAASGPSPSSIVRQRERDDQLDLALLALSDRYRKVLLLRHQDGLTFPDIGDRLDISAEAARKVWLRAVQALRRELGRVDGFR